MVAARLHVDLEYQGTGGVDGEHIAGFRGRGHGLGHAVCRKDHRLIRLRYLVEFFHKNGAFGFEIVDHVAIVDDLVAHIDGCPELLQRQFDDPDGTVDAGAEAAGRCQQDRQRRQRPQAGAGVGHG